MSAQPQSQGNQSPASPPFAVCAYQVLATPRGLFCSLVSNETGFNSNSALSTQKATKNTNESPQLPLKSPRIPLEWERVKGWREKEDAWK